MRDMFARPNAAIYARQHPAARPVHPTQQREQAEGVLIAD